MTYLVFIDRTDGNVEFCGYYDGRDYQEAIQKAHEECKGEGLIDCLWETARAAGHVLGFCAPEVDNEKLREMWINDAQYHEIDGILYVAILDEDEEEEDKDEEGGE